MSDVVIVRERCAKTDPPERSGEYFPTDVGILLYDANRKSWGEWVEVADEFFPALPQPRVWYDFPRDTERAGLTEDDLRWLVEQHEAREWTTVKEAETVARLRAALDALNTTEAGGE